LGTISRFQEFPELPETSKNPGLSGVFLCPSSRVHSDLYPSDQTTIVSLGKHDFKTAVYPEATIDLGLPKNPTLRFTVEVAAHFEAAALNIRNGHIMAVETGDASVSAESPFALPGRASRTFLRYCHYSCCPAASGFAGRAKASSSHPCDPALFWCHASDHRRSRVDPSVVCDRGRRAGPVFPLRGVDVGVDAARDTTAPGGGTVGACG